MYAIFDSQAESLSQKISVEGLAPKLAKHFDISTKKLIYGHVKELEEKQKQKQKQKQEDDKLMLTQNQNTPTSDSIESTRINPRLRHVVTLNCEQEVTLPRNFSFLWEEQLYVSSKPTCKRLCRVCLLCLFVLVENILIIICAVFVSCVCLC